MVGLRSLRELVPAYVLRLAVSAVAISNAAQAADKGATEFNRTIAPILVKRCLECHNEREAAGKLVLTTQERMLAGGENGPPIVPGKPDESYLLQRVADGEMPPERQGRSQALPKAEVDALRAWIAAGAAWPKGRTLDLYEVTTDVRGGRDWWSFQPVRRPRIPMPHRTRGDNPIDAFILARLQAEGFEPAPPADKRALIRRLYHDLVGLPPAAEEIERFTRDEDPLAYEKLVDRLLSSPHFGERWGRYWLDLVRFAETCGYERDQEKPGAWKYRDWVIRAINEDKPLDRFVLEQLAGDELPDRCEETVIATGFLRLGTWNDEPNDDQEYKYERLEDMVHATATAFLGLTVKCARCHDHKFDPIPQVDYYRLANTFWPGAIEPRQRELLGGPSKEELGYDVLGWTDIRSPPPLHLLKKGDPRHPGPAVPPGQLSLVPALDRPLAGPPTGAKTTHRRLQLAQWIVDTQNPLTPRVFVNRLWLHHFGQGLVRTPNNFGYKGDRPTHPELLDWLAGELVRGGWCAKPLHRLIVTSRTYRQSSLHPRQEEYARHDAANHLWWRAERRRLDAESLRDAMLAAGGQLDPRFGGPSFRPEISPEALEGLSRKSAAWQASPPHEQQRRSIYIFTQRSLLPPMLTTFDFCDTTEPCGQRDVSIVAPQALALLNNRFVHQQSKALARRVLAAASEDQPAQVSAAWRFALGRAPNAREEAAALRHLAAQARNLRASEGSAKFLALASLCHVLLNSNEFVYVD